MARKRNAPTDVFKSIDMTAGKDACWPWKSDAKGGGRDGRPYFRLDGKRVLAYVLTWELMNGQKVPDGMVLRHTCDNGAAPIRCCNPQHLELGTHEDNMRDMRERGRHGLPHHTIRYVRRLDKDGRTNAQIAELTGIPRQTVTDIVQRTTYKEVNDDDDAITN